MSMLTIQSDVKNDKTSIVFVDLL